MKNRILLSLLILGMSGSSVCVTEEPSENMQDELFQKRLECIKFDVIIGTVMGMAGGLLYDVAENPGKVEYTNQFKRGCSGAALGALAGVVTGYCRGTWLGREQSVSTDVRVEDFKVFDASQTGVQRFENEQAKLLARKIDHIKSKACLGGAMGAGCGLMYGMRFEPVGQIIGCGCVGAAVGAATGVLVCDWTGSLLREVYKEQQASAKRLQVKDSEIFDAPRTDVQLQ